MSSKSGGIKTFFSSLVSTNKKIDDSIVPKDELSIENIENSIQFNKKSTKAVFPLFSEKKRKQQDTNIVTIEKNKDKEITPKKQQRECIIIDLSGHPDNAEIDVSSGRRASSRIAATKEKNHDNNNEVIILDNEQIRKNDSISNQKKEEEKDKSNSKKKTKESGPTNLFFLSKEEKALLLLQEKDRKIQEQAALARAETNRLFSSSGCTGSGSNKTMNPFFLKPVGNNISSSSNSSTLMKTTSNNSSAFNKSDSNDDSFSYFPWVQYVGEGSLSIPSIELQSQPMKRMKRVDDKDDDNLDEEGVKELERLLHLRNNEDSNNDTTNRILVDLSQLDLFPSFTTTSSSCFSLDWRHLWMLMVPPNISFSSVSSSNGSYNSSNTDMQQYLSDWLRSLSMCKTPNTSTKKKKRRKSRNNYSEYEDDDDNDDDFNYEEEDGYNVSGENEFSSSGPSGVMLLQGPSGSGKTASVYSAAESLGLGVVEINASQSRGAAAVKKLFFEAAQSHSVNHSTAATILLFDEVDASVCAEEDNGLFSALVALARATKSPVVVTAETGMAAVVLRTLQPHLKVFGRRTTQKAQEHLLDWMDNNNNIEEEEVEKKRLLGLLACVSSGDVRAATCSLELMKGSTTSSSSSCSSIMKSLSDFMVSLWLDFAIFDNLGSLLLLLLGEDIIIRENREDTKTMTDEKDVWEGLFVPVVDSVDPRSAVFSDSNTTTITEEEEELDLHIIGKNFLQRYCDVKVLVDDNEEMVSSMVVLSDALLFCRIPLRWLSKEEGLHVVSVSLHHHQQKKKKKSEEIVRSVGVGYFMMKKRVIRDVGLGFGGVIGGNARNRGRGRRKSGTTVVEMIDNSLDNQEEEEEDNNNNNNNNNDHDNKDNNNDNNNNDNYNDNNMDTGVVSHISDSIKKLRRSIVTTSDQQDDEEECVFLDNQDDNNNNNNNRNSRKKGIVDSDSDDDDIQQQQKPKRGGGKIRIVNSDDDDDDDIIDDNPKSVVDHLDCLSNILTLMLSPCLSPMTTGLGFTDAGLTLSLDVIADLTKQHLYVQQQEQQNVPDICALVQDLHKCVSETRDIRPESRLAGVVLLRLFRELIRRQLGDSDLLLQQLVIQEEEEEEMRRRSDEVSDELLTQVIDDLVVADNNGSGSVDTLLQIVIGNNNNNNDTRNECPSSLTNEQLEEHLQIAEIRRNISSSSSSSSSSDKEEERICVRRIHFGVECLHDLSDLLDRLSVADTIRSMDNIPFHVGEEEEEDDKDWSCPSVDEEGFWIRHLSVSITSKEVLIRRERGDSDYCAAVSEFNRQTEDSPFLQYRLRRDQSLRSIKTALPYLCPTSSFINRSAEVDTLPMLLHMIHTEWKSDEEVLRILDIPEVLVEESEDAIWTGGRRSLRSSNRRSLGASREEQRKQFRRFKHMSAGLFLLENEEVLMDLAQIRSLC